MESELYYGLAIKGKVEPYTPEAQFVKIQIDKKEAVRIVTILIRAILDDLRVELQEPIKAIVGRVPANSSQVRGVKKEVKDQDLPSQSS